MEQDSEPSKPPSRLMEERESSTAYAALKLYYELGDSRSIPKLKKKCKNSVVSLYKWQKTYRWDERIDAADAEASAIFRRALEKKAEALADKLAEQRLKVAEGIFEITMLAQAKAKEILQYMSVRDVQTTHDGKNIILRSNPNIRITDAVRLLLGANVAMQQAEISVSPKGRAKAGQTPAGSSIPRAGLEAPIVEIWLDGGDGRPLPLSMMPEPDKLDPNFHPDLEDGSTPAAT